MKCNFTCSCRSNINAFMLINRFKYWRNLKQEVYPKYVSVKCWDTLLILMWDYTEFRLGSGSRSHECKRNIYFTIFFFSVDRSLKSGPKLKKSGHPRFRVTRRGSCQIDFGVKSIWHHKRWRESLWLGPGPETLRLNLFRLGPRVLQYFSNKYCAQCFFSESYFSKTLLYLKFSALQVVRKDRRGRGVSPKLSPPPKIFSPNSSTSLTLTNTRSLHR